MTYVILCIIKKVFRWTLRNYHAYLVVFSTIFSVHTLNVFIDNMHPSSVHQDHTSKMSTKYNAINIKTVTKDYYHLLTEFRKCDMDDRLKNNVEEYLVYCLSKRASNDEGFNDSQYSMYHQKSFQMDVEKLTCTSSIQYHIFRSYFQCFHWLHAPFQNLTFYP